MCQPSVPAARGGGWRRHSRWPVEHSGGGGAALEERAAAGDALRGEEGGGGGGLQAEGS